MQENKTAPFPGRLYVFEGPDGVGKTTIIDHVADILRLSDKEVVQLNFPGKKTGTLGKIVYDFHHSPGEFGVEDVNHKSLQVLHVAAHIDCIERDILPALASGKTVLLDRYWWSTVVYGTVDGISKKTLDNLMRLENSVWCKVLPSSVFLLTADRPYREELPSDRWMEVKQAYASVARKEQKRYEVQILDNNSSVQDISTKIAASILSKNEQINLPFKDLDLSHPKTGVSDGFVVAVKWLPTKTTPVFDTYWRFAAERQCIFFERITGTKAAWTQDPILRLYKFTNTYRASDRVSQYLIKHVIYEGDQSPEELFFRIILFKTFNKIETWKLLRQNNLDVSYRHFDFERYDSVLSEALAKKQSIYSAAYIMLQDRQVLGRVSNIVII
ncbi:nucleotide kinase domain-containing protein [Geotalea toluenoxydans]|uniref:nucleotide kinase domain-containing protein n=1 Tax=Geotalea toluenoxydans TaxID=421624 RepID=UPI000A5A1402|nr:nucleotide kinase domain-containing protein [Geotalea toluenoxydans]